MHITIEYTAQIKRAAGVASESLDVDAGTTVRELLNTIGEQHGEALQSLLLDERGEIQASILVFVGEEQIRDCSQAILKDGCTVSLLSPISGG